MTQMMRQNLKNNILKICIYSILGLLSLPIMAQPIDLNKGLETWFDFDRFPLQDKSGSNNSIVFMTGDTVAPLGCGAIGNALQFDGQRLGMQIIGPAVFDQFKTFDFSLSFYFKANQQVGSNVYYDLFSKKRACSSDSSFSIRYNPGFRTLSVELIERGTKRHVINTRLDLLDTIQRYRCWYHIAVVRSFNKLFLYVNGKLVGEPNVAVSRVAITNSEPLRFSGGPCVNVTDRRFQGMLDEVRIYSRAITADEVAALYSNPDELVNRDTVIFLGRSIQTGISKTCASRFSWQPTEGVEKPDSARTTITPVRAGQHYYTLTMQDQQFCGSTDAFRVTVIDPNSVDCSKVYLPSAFTPQKDGLNEEFFISNPYTINSLTRFDIYDGYGAIIFSTTDKEGRWDGTMNGKPLNPGVYMWKVIFTCDGREITQFGTVALIR